MLKRLTQGTFGSVQSSEVKACHLLRTMCELVPEKPPFCMQALSSELCHCRRCCCMIAQTAQERGVLGAMLIRWGAERGASRVGAGGGGG